MSGISKSQIDQTNQKKSKKTQRVEFKFENAEELQERITRNQLTEEDLQFFSTLLQWYIWLVGKVKKMRRLGWLKEALGLSSSSSKKAEESASTKAKNVENEGGSENDSASEKKKPQGNPKGKGHGRTPVEAYTGAERKLCPHGSLRVGDRCPLCDGKLYELSKPKTELCFTGSPPVMATRYDLQQLQCSSCRATFTANLPETAGSQKYDERVRAILGILTYTQGFPAKRIETLQDAFGIPMAATTQWGLIKEMIGEIFPVYEILLKMAAQAKLFYQDDTGVKIVELLYENRDLDPKKDRVGMHTTALVAEGEIDGARRRIVLYFASRKHAGENLGELLEKREAGLPLPLQMSDASSSNHKMNSKTIPLFCNAHALRNFKENTLMDFPKSSKYILHVLGLVYKHDEIAEQLELSEQERLQFHQQTSAPLMADLKIWMENQFENKEVEPNSSLGQAMTYMLKRWEALTGFLRVPGAPLDNNEVERALKIMIRHRKASFFFKTVESARLVSGLVSLIQTCIEAGKNPLNYLVQLQKHFEDVSQNPKAWLPWNYEATLATG